MVVMAEPNKHLAKAKQRHVGNGNELK